MGDEQVVDVEDRYLDTAYGALEQAGFGARLRREDGGSIVVTVKTVSRDRVANETPEATGGPLALSQRVEVEGLRTCASTPTCGRPARRVSSSTRSVTAHA
jgi:hypothetical protein